VPPLLVAATLFVLGVAIPVTERRSRASIQFALLTLVLGVWLFGYSMMYLSTEADAAYWWSRAGLAGVAFIPAAVYHFTLVLLGKYWQERFYVWLVWAFSLFLCDQLVWSDLFVTGVQQHWWGYYPRFTAHGLLFLVFFVTPLLAVMWHFWTEYRAQRAEKQRTRTRDFMIAVLVGYLALIDFVPAFGFAVYPFGYLPILAFAILASGVIHRHRLVSITPALAADQILETMRGAVIVTDQTDTITVANHAACQILDFSAAELIGSPIARVLPNPFSEASPRLYRNQPMTWKRKDGSLIEMSVSASILGPRGELPAGIIYTALDMSELKQAEAEIKQNVSLLRATLEATTDGILVIDLNGRIVSANQRFAQMWNIPQEILETRDDKRAIEFVLNQLKHPSVFLAKVAELYSKPEVESFDVLEFKDGRTFERYSAPQRLDGKPVGRVWSFRDVTERRRSEEALYRRDMIMEAVAFAAEQFLITTNWKKSIDRVLGQLGRATAVHRVFIYQSDSSHGELRFSQNFEWTAEGTRAQSADPQFHNMAVPRAFSGWVERLQRGEAVQGRLNDLSTDQRAGMRGSPTQSLILLPIMVANRLWGSLGFADNERERHWLPIEAEALKAAAEILAAAIERQEAEEALEASETRYRLLFERNLAGVFRVTLDGRVMDCNDAFARIFGYPSREAVIGLPAGQFYFDPAERERFIRNILERRALTNVELKLRRRDGSPVWVLENVILMVEDQGEPILEGTLADITDRKVAEQQIEYQAYHDALTGLPNRMLFQDRLTIALAHANRTGQPLAVMFLDLDHFKFVNDTLGHTVGDLLLQGVAERLTQALREEDTVARLGGDEFTLLLSHLASHEDAGRIAQKLLETIALPFTLENHDLYVTTSIGIAMHPEDGDDAETLLKNADSAMYRAKELGRNNYQLYTPAMNRLALERLSIENSLRRALERQEFVVFYQPQVHLETRQVVGLEALVRWIHPERGLIGPTEFIGIAEDSRLIFPLGEWVLREACRQTVVWQQEYGLPNLRIAVNLSARQFQQRDLVGTIAAILEQTRLLPSCLELEITEGIAMQNTEYTIALMKELRMMGIRIALDDFGTGHSSLHYLTRFPIDTIKIDQSFVRDLSLTPASAIVSAMITMAQGMKLRVIAEGVETEEQLRFLRKRRCELMQGYLFSAARPAGEMESILGSREQKRDRGSQTADSRRS
jgi:diguanylate cyclase (GGDEF)-like protein/PAS domain S-box-containing protein